VSGGTHYGWIFGYPLGSPLIGPTTLCRTCLKQVSCSGAQAATVLCEPCAMHLNRMVEVEIGRMADQALSRRAMERLVGAIDRLTEKGGGA